MLKLLRGTFPRLSFWDPKYKLNAFKFKILSKMFTLKNVDVINSKKHLLFWKQLISNHQNKL